ncbi:MAG: AIM24 family protein [Lachnospiraceae bacterium]|nr:AIM24 family protein [Lachnospiraceae bacterium]
MKTNFLQETEFKKVVGRKGNFNIVEYVKDVSVTPSRVVAEYYAGAMNVRRRQVAVEMKDSEVIVQTGAMQWTAGNVQAATNIKGAGDLAKKMISASVTKESAIKPKYMGSGLLVLEPTYKHLILIDMANWLDGIVMDDGLFLACDATIDLKTVARSTLSSAVLGNEGLFNTMLYGPGTAVLESPVPASELVLVSLENDTLKVDGNYAIAWSKSLKFTVEKTTKTLIGSAASGEGLVNVYSGTGSVLMAPIL